MFSPAMFSPNHETFSRLTLVFMVLVKALLLVHYGKNSPRTGLRDYCSMRGIQELILSLKPSLSAIFHIAPAAVLYMVYYTGNLCYQIVKVLLAWPLNGS